MPPSATATTELARFLSTTGPEQFSMLNEKGSTYKASSPFFRLRSVSQSNKKKKKQLLLLQRQHDEIESVNVLPTTSITPKARSPYRFQQQQHHYHKQHNTQHHKKHIPLPVYVPPSPSPPPNPTVVSSIHSSSITTNSSKHRHSNHRNINTKRTSKNNTLPSTETTATKGPSTSSTASLIPTFPKPPSSTVLRTPTSSDSLPSPKTSSGSREEKCPHCCRRFKSIKKNSRRTSCPAAIHYKPTNATNTSSTETSSKDKINNDDSKQQGGLTSQEAKTLLQMIEKLQHQLVQEQTSRQALEKALQNASHHSHKNNEF